MSRTQQAGRQYDSPVDVEAERILLGSATLHERAAGWMAANVPPEAFAVGGHQAIFEAIREVAASGATPDLALVAGHLRRTKQLGSVGGEDYLIQIAEGAASPSQARHYGARVLEAFARRLVRQRCTDLFKHAESGELDSVLDRAFDLPRGIGNHGTDTVWTGDVDIDAPGCAIDGVASGIKALDGHCSGHAYYRGETALIVASRGFGKTAWLIQATIAAAKRGHKTAYATLEMGASQIQRRMVQNLSGWGRPPDNPLVRQNYDLDAEQVKAWNIPIYDPSRRRGGDRTVEALVAWIVDLHDTHRLDLVAVDYAQKLNSGATRYDNRTRELDHCAEELSWLAKRLGIAIVMGSQLSLGPNGERRSKDSIRFEDEAGLVLYPKRDKETGKIEVEIGKNRYGTEGEFELVWDGSRVAYLEPYNPAEDTD